jgi:hypothetical protein
MCGERYSETELRKMIEHADRELKDGRLSYADFVAVLEKDFPKN